MHGFDKFWNGNDSFLEKCQKKTMMIYDNKHKILTSFQKKLIRFSFLKFTNFNSNEEMIQNL